MDTETPSNVNSESSVVNEVNTDLQKFNGSDANINTEISEINCLRNEMMECDLDLLHDLRNDGSEEDKDILQSHCLQDLMSNPEFFSCIQIPVNKSPAEVLLMVLEHVLKYKASLTEILSILQLINIIFSRLILPYAWSILDRILNPKRTLKYHGICPNCCAYMGSIDNCKCFVTCNGCSEVIDFNGPSSSNIFLIIDPSEKIKLLIEENQSYYNYVVKERKYSGKITDIFDGKCYRSFVKKLPTNERHSYATTIFNTDGAPRFECSQYSIWPMYLQVNELPVEIRLKSIITCEIWFGKNKPNMAAFLQPFTQVMEQLYTTGVQCNINNEVRLIKVYALICCVDSVARAPMQGIKLFNGRYGCNWCLHKGEWYEGSTRYHILQSRPIQRTVENMIESMEKITNEEFIDDVNGVIDVSPLINLSNFDIVKGFVPDFMHCYLAGVGKQITKQFLNIIPKSTVQLLNTMLLDIKVPHQLGRSTRSFEDINQWKAKEWENFILYYSLPLFKFALEERLVKYWILIVDSLHSLLKCEIKFEELNKVDEDLHKFVYLTEKLFSKKSMTYNIHQLLHITESVMNWGPLWCHSTFPFESANHDSLQAIHCAKGVNLQIVRYINMQESVHILRNHIYTNASPLVIAYCKEITTRNIKNSCKLSSITYLGNGTITDKDIAQRFGMSVFTVTYCRAIKDGCLYSSSEKNNKRSDNSFALLSDNTFIRINTFLVDNTTNKEITLCNIVNTSAPLCKFINSVRNIGNKIIGIETSKIVQVCVFIKVNMNYYICTLPNLYHY